MIISGFDGSVSKCEGAGGLLTISFFIAWRNLGAPNPFGKFQSVSYLSNPLERGAVFQLSELTEAAKLTISSGFPKCRGRNIAQAGGWALSFSSTTIAS